MVLDLVPTAIPALRRALPLPGRERWEPLRAGIIGVWQYEDQEFLFERGRLVLQGRNGAGKTKVLEVLFPFVLDARNDPWRLAPGGGDGRTMRWNLLELEKDGTSVHKRRDGIVWLEFGRRSHTGAVEFCTVGARMLASSGKPKVDISYFMTDRRPGEELALLVPLADRPGLVPVSLRALAEAIDGHGRVFESATAYRAAVDERLFGLRDRYDGLLGLLISLRRPKLSEKLDLESLMGHLRDALPPVNDDQVRQLADALDSLRDDEQGLARMKQARGAVEVFLTDYRDYAARAERGTAQRLRDAEQAVTKAQDALREAEQEAAAAERESSRLEAAVADAETQESAVAGALDAHRRSPEMQSATALEAAESAARTMRSRATDAARAASVLEDEAGRATSDLAETEGELKRASTTAEGLALAAAADARRAVMEPAHAAYLAARAADSVAAARALEQAIALRRSALAERVGEAHVLRQLTASRRAAEDDELHAREAHADALARVGVAKDALAAARSALEEALVLWAAGLEELDPDTDELAAAADRVAERGRLTDALEALASGHRAELARADERLAGEAGRLTETLEALARDRAALVSATVSRPPRATTRPADRTGRPGAPFYEVVDFADGLDDAARAGYEAALHGAGILDAWVMPDGRLAEDDLDAVVHATGPVAGRSLADILVPAGEAVPADAVLPILRSISAEPSGTAWVAPDGAFSIGPLAGRFAQPEAGYIGAGAQAATRARRIAEIDRLAVEAEGQRDTVAAAREAVAKRVAAVADELRATPDDEPARAASRTLGQREAAVTSGAEAVKRAEQRVLDLRKREAVKADALADALAALGFPPGSTDIDAAVQALADYRGSASSLTTADGTLAAVRRRAERGREHAVAIAGKAAAARETAGSAEGDAVSAEAAAAERRQLYGATGAAAIARLRELEEQAKAITEGLRRDRAEHLKTVERRGVSKQREEDAKVAEGSADEVRTIAAAAFGRFAASPLHALSTGTPADGDPLAWAVRTAVEAARRIDTTDRASFEPQALAAARKVVFSRFAELQGQIGAEFALAMDPTAEDDFLLVDAQHGDDRVAIGWLSAFLARTIAEQEEQLDARMREVLQRYLFEGIGEELGDRIREARSLIGRMNHELDACPTPSGMRLHLRWDLGPDVPGGADRATDLLLLAPGTLSDTDRDVIVRFLQARVADARSEESSTGFAEALITALDYRGWFAFSLEETNAQGRRHRINARDYAAGSGGEKAVTLHLPLFAAVAAYYTGEARHAPRLFFLDEAFAGIDRPMRGLMMRFIVRFDLDFVFTTPDDLCTYAELDGAAVYQLTRDPVERAIDAHRWVWTGVELLDDDALRALDEAAG